MMSNRQCGTLIPLLNFSNIIYNYCMKSLIKKIVKFRDQRDWKKFHTPLNIAISLQLEASELLEHFQWKSNDEFVKLYATNSKKRKAVQDEVADIFSYLLLFADSLNIDLEKIWKIKMKDNNKKYPVSKSRGNSKKYTEYTEFT